MHALSLALCAAKSYLKVHSNPLVCMALNIYLILLNVSFLFVFLLIFDCDTCRQVAIQLFNTVLPLTLYTVHKVFI